jgi:hypothetical protein
VVTARGAVAPPGLVYDPTYPHGAVDQLVLSVGCGGTLPHGVNRRRLDLENDADLPWSGIRVLFPTEIFFGQRVNMPARAFFGDTLDLATSLDVSDRDYRDP